MKRPYVFCHMMTSIDGKIMGNYMDIKESDKAGEVFYKIAFGDDPYYKHQGWLSGRITTDDNFTFYETPMLDEHAPIVPKGDYVSAPNADRYYVSIDPSGKLGWKSHLLKYKDTDAEVLEVLTENASNPYKAMLRELGISYIIVGKDSLDIALVLEKLNTLFGIETLMLGGGGVLNWSLIQEGLCDEVSIVIAPAADGSSNTPSLFETRGIFTNDTAVGFELKDVQVMDGDSVWLRYLVNNAKAK